MKRKSIALLVAIAVIVTNSTFYVNAEDFSSEAADNVFADQQTDEMTYDEENASIDFEDEEDEVSDDIEIEDTEDEETDTDIGEEQEEEINFTDAESDNEMTSEPEATDTAVFAGNNEIVSGDYTYKVSGTDATITKYTGNSSTVSIPLIIDGYNVTAIGNGAFKGCSQIVKVIMPKGIINIGDNAFSNCTNLKEINLPEGLEKIGCFFIENTAVTSLKVPKTVKYSGHEYFPILNGATSGALELKKIVFEEGMTKIPDYFCLSEAENTTLVEIEIPESVTEIGKSAFCNCKGLTNIKFGKKIQKIGSDAYRNCVGLKKIEFQKNEEKVAKSDGTEELCSVTVGIRAFQDCTGLEQVILSPNISEMGDGIFKGCNLLTQIDVPEGVKSIGNNAFSNCKNLKEINLPEGLEKIGCFFIENTAVTSLKVPKTVKYSGHEYFPILNGATSGALELREIVFEEGMTKIPDYFCLSNAENATLAEIEIPESVTEIGKHSFDNCKNITIYGHSGSYAEIYAKENNIPFVSIGSVSRKLNVSAAFSNGKSRKELYWTKDGYSEKELKLNIKVSGAYAHIKEIELELQDLKMFKVAGASKTTNTGKNYYYTVNTDKSIKNGETALLQVTLEKKGLTWWKPNDKELHSGYVNVIVTGETLTGDIIQNTTAIDSQLLIEYQNDIKVNEAIEAEKKAIEDAKKQAETASKNVTKEFKELEKNLTLDATIANYIGADQFRALKLLIYTEISLANISKAYFTEAGLSEKVATKAMKTFLGVDKIDFGIAEKNVPIEVIVLGKNGKQYQFKFMCNVQVYSNEGKQFGIFGNIQTEMWEIKGGSNKKKITCAPGMISKADVQAFSESVWEVAKSSLFNAYKSVWGTDADKVANGIMKDSVDSMASKAAKYGIEEPVQIILNKFYEKTLKNKFADGFFKLLIYPSKKIIAHCPVDVYIYDSSNALVGSIENDVVTKCEDGVALWTEGDDKYIQLFRNDYRVVYKANGTGSMDIEIYDQMLNDFNYRKCELLSVPLDIGSEYSQSVDNVLMTDISNYALNAKDGNKIEACNEQELYTDEYPSEHSHSWNEGVITKKATCEEEGIILYTCTECNETREDEIDKKGHSWGQWKKISDATVKKAESWQRTCLICKKNEKESRGKKLTSTMKLSTANLKLQTKQKTKVLQVMEMKKGDFVSSVKSNDTKLIKVTGFSKSGSITLKAQNKTGKAKITIVLAGGAKKILPVTIQKGKVQTSEIKGILKKLTLKKGKSLKLKPVLIPLTSQEKVTYKSSNKNIATVSAKGVIKGKKKGTAKITVQSGKKKYVVNVKVR